MFEVTNGAKFMAGIDKFEKQLCESVENFYRGWTVKMFQQLVWTTPQWTGSAASNWKFSVGTVDSSYQTRLLSDMTPDITELFGATGNRRKRGHRGAVQEAFMNNKGRDSAIKCSGGKLPPVFLSNFSKSLTGESYIGYLESNENNFLRPENEPGHMVKNVMYRFGTLGKVNLQAVQAFSKGRL